MVTSCSWMETLKQRLETSIARSRCFPTVNLEPSYLSTWNIYFFVLLTDGGEGEMSKSLCTFNHLLAEELQGTAALCLQIKD